MGLQELHFTCWGCLIVPYCVQGHIGQQPLDAVPSFGGSTTAGTESSYRLWDPSKVPSPRKIVAALDKFVVGQEGTKKVSQIQECDCSRSGFSGFHLQCTISAPFPAH